MIHFTFVQTFTENHPESAFDLQRGGKDYMLIYSPVITVITSAPTRQQLLQN